MRVTELGTVQSGGIRLDHEVRRRVVEHALLDDHPRCAAASAAPRRAARDGDGLADGVAREPHRRAARRPGRRRASGSGAMPAHPAPSASTPFTATRPHGAPVVVTGSHGPSIAGTTDVAFRQAPRMPHA